MLSIMHPTTTGPPRPWCRQPEAYHQHTALHMAMKSHCALPLGCKKGPKPPLKRKRFKQETIKEIQKKYDERKKKGNQRPLEEQFQQGKLLACIASRPGQCGRADGYVLEGKESALSEEDQGLERHKPFPPVLAHLIKVSTVPMPKKKKKFTEFFVA